MFGSTLLLLLNNGGGSGPPDIPDDLVDAVVAIVNAAMVPGQLAWFGTGDALGGQELPYATMGEPDEDDDYWSADGDSKAEGRLEITCYAPGKKQARLLGDRLAAAIEAARVSGSILFSAGQLFYIRQSGRTAGLDPDPAPDGGDCWSETRQFHFMYSC